MTRSKRSSQMRNQRKRQGSEAIPHPPQIRPSIIWTNRLRFTVTTAATGKSFSVNNLFDTVLVAKTTTAGSQLFTNLRLKAVEVWGPSPAAGTATTVSVFFPTVSTAGFAVGGDNVVFSDTSVSVEPAHVRASPAGTASSLWQSNQDSSATPNNNSIFVITAPVGSVVDVLVEFSNGVGLSAFTQAVANALVGAVAGTVYFRGLDGVAVATTTFPSILLNQSI